MVLFAKLDENNIVTQVIVLSEECILNEEGIEVEEIGQNFLKSKYGEETKWLMTSKDGSIRKNYAGIGYTYNEELDAFIPPKPFESWVFDENRCVYVAPVSLPDENKPYFWDESNKEWV